MLFRVENKRFLSTEQLRTNTLLDAYFIIQKYPLKASEQLLEQYLEQQYKTTLKNLCIKILLSATFHKDLDGNLVILFNDPTYDRLAQLITYGTGAIPGSRILQIALAN